LLVVRGVLVALCLLACTFIAALCVGCDSGVLVVWCWWGGSFVFWGGGGGGGGHAPRPP